MEIEEAVYGRLTSDAGVAALAGSRVYPGQAPQSGAFPVIVYTEASQKVVMSLTGPVNLNAYSMHLDVWGEDYAEVKATYHAVRDCLVGYSGEIGTGSPVKVRGVFEESGDDGAEPPIHAEESGLWRAGLDLAIWYGN